MLPHLSLTLQKRSRLSLYCITCLLPFVPIQGETLVVEQTPLPEGVATEQVAETPVQVEAVSSPIGDTLQKLAVELDAREAELKVVMRQRAEVLNTREDAVALRESEMTGRETTLAAREAALAKRETLVVAREKLLGTQEVALVQAKPKWPAPTVVGKYAVVMDALTGQVLHAKDADKEVAVASTQKLMTALVVIDEGGLDEIVTVEPADTQVEPTIIGIRAGQTYTRRQLIEALLVRSGNDIALCLARDNAGSVEAFATKMNAKALSLGMANTNFINPHGLTVSGQYSTAGDMALLARAAYANPVIRGYVDQTSATFKFSDGRVTTLTNTNKVLRNNSWCNGMKTGYTRASGNCLVSSGEKEGRARIVVVLGSSGAWIWKDSEVLLEWALKS